MAGRAVAAVQGTAYNDVQPQVQLLPRGRKSNRLLIAEYSLHSFVALAFASSYRSSSGLRCSLKRVSKSATCNGVLSSERNLFVSERREEEKSRSCEHNQKSFERLRKRPLPHNFTYKVCYPRTTLSNDSKRLWEKRPKLLK